MGFWKSLFQRDASTSAGSTQEDERWSAACSDMAHGATLAEIYAKYGESFVKRRYQLEKDRVAASSRGWLERMEREKAEIERNKRIMSVWTEHPEILIDSVTGLLWTAKDNGFPISCRQAFVYAATLSLGSLSNWRLPTIDELSGIYQKHNDTAWYRYDESNILPVCTVDGFQLSGSDYCSSTKTKSDSTQSLCFVQGNRQSCEIDEIDDGSRVLCVHDPLDELPAHLGQPKKRERYWPADRLRKDEGEQRELWLKALAEIEQGVNVHDVYDRYGIRFVQERYVHDRIRRARRREELIRKFGPKDAHS